MLVVALASGVSIGVVGYLQSAEVDGVRSSLSDRKGVDLALEFSLGSDPDVDAQDARVNRLLDTIFRNGNRVLPVTVIRSVASADPVELSTAASGRHAG